MKGLTNGFQPAEVSETSRLPDIGQIVTLLAPNDRQYTGCLVKDPIDSSIYWCEETSQNGALEERLGLEAPIGWKHKDAPLQ